ncbi:MAG: methylmalonyl Co-A mutase-associated GTPase MeaB [Myxococcales bacterium]|nr:methylmalonyl Co-A mutase-associated GTPase MeaB [Myxococcales bacterium]
MLTERHRCLRSQGTPAKQEERPLGLQDIDTVAEKVLAKNIRAAARAMRWVDDRDPRANDLLRKLYPHTGNALILGVTGNPGSGKSTLVNALIGQYRANGKTVGVCAVDPSSPFSGGAILGDRIRMQDHFNDDGVFIRSLATRGHLGGLSGSTLDTVTIMDAMGLDVIIVETVGVGQDEVEVVRMADTTVVVVVPGLGDEIQALKAGILEIADVFCINKADRDGVDRLEADIQSMQEFDHAAGRSFRPVIRTVAIRGEGIGELCEAIQAHASGSDADGRRLTGQTTMRLRTVLDDRLLGGVLKALRSEGTFEDAVARILDRKSDPYTEAERLIARGIELLAQAGDPPEAN